MGNKNIKIAKGTWRSARKDVKMFVVGSSEEEIRRYQELVYCLGEELYYNVMPKYAADYVKRGIGGLLNEQIEYLLGYYGDKDLGFIPDGTEMPKGDGCASWFYIHPKVCLIGQQTSMPLKDFLYQFYKLGKSEEIAKWSGIPEDEQVFVYSTVLAFFRKKLISINTTTTVTE